MSKGKKSSPRLIDHIVDSILRGIVNIMIIFFVDLKIRGTQNVPEGGPYIIAVNHMSKADPPLLLVAFPGVHLRFFAAEKWNKHIIFGPLLKWGGGIFINRGEVDRRALSQALKALGDGSIFGLAPEGTRSRVGALIRARDGAAYLATRANVPVLPVGVVDTDILGFNMSRFKRTELQVNIGEPFSLPGNGQRAKGSELSAYTHLIMVHIAALLPEKHWGYYADSPALKAYLASEDPWPYCLAAEGLTPKSQKPKGKITTNS